MMNNFKPGEMTFKPGDKVRAINDIEFVAEVDQSIIIGNKVQVREVTFGQVYVIPEDWLEHADLIARANHFVGLIGYGNRIDQEFARLIRDLRDALVAANAKPVIPDAVRAVLEDNIAEYPNAEIEAFLAAHQPLEDETK